MEVFGKWQKIHVHFSHYMYFNGDNPNKSSNCNKYAMFANLFNISTEFAFRLQITVQIDLFAQPAESE